MLEKTCDNFCGNTMNLYHKHNMMHLTLFSPRYEDTNRKIGYFLDYTLL